MKYLAGTQYLCLTLRACKKISLKWYVDAALAVHSDFKSHTGATLTMAKGEIVSMSQTETEHKKQHGGGVSRPRLRVKYNTMDQYVSIIPRI